MFLLSYEGIEEYILTLKNNKGDPYVFVVDIYTHTDKEIVKANGLLFELSTALKSHGHMLQGLFLNTFDCSRINADTLATLVTHTASIDLEIYTPLTSGQLSVIKSAIHPDLIQIIFSQKLLITNKSAIEDIQKKVAANQQAAAELAESIVDQEFADIVTDIGLVDKLLERPHAVAAILLRQSKGDKHIVKQFQKLLLPACLYAKALHKAKEEHAQLTAQDSSVDDKKNDDDSAQQIVFNFPELFNHIQAEAERVGIKTAEQFKEIIINLEATLSEYLGLSGMPYSVMREADATATTSNFFGIDLDDVLIEQGIIWPYIYQISSSGSLPKYHIVQQRGGEQHVDEMSLNELYAAYKMIFSPSLAEEKFCDVLASWHLDTATINHLLLPEKIKSKLLAQDTATDYSGANDELQAGDSGYCSSDDATLDAGAVLIGEADFS